MKGVILAAGYGTRFLPVTKTIPKEMLPLIDTPCIGFILEEFRSSGIRDVVIISSRRKRSLEDFLDREIELESLLTPLSSDDEARKKQKEIQRKKMNRFNEMNLTVIRQKEMQGTGHALLQARPFVGGEAVVVAYPDDLHRGDIPLSRQLIECFQEASTDGGKTGPGVLASLHNPPDLNRYGVLKLGDGYVEDIIEKPPVGEEPSREASIGRFLYPPEFFDYLAEGWEKHKENYGDRYQETEYYHIYALRRLIEQKKLVHRSVRGEILATGTPEDYLRAVIRYAAGNPLYREILWEEMRRAETA